MIVWSGSGIMVAIYNVVFFFVVMFAASSLSPDAALGTPWIFGATGLLAAAATFFTVRFIENKPGRVFVDEATSQRIEVKPNAGSFFFIPTRYWPYINIAAGVGLAILFYFDKPTTPLV